jgi:hypothetical protein
MTEEEEIELAEDDLTPPDILRKLGRSRSGEVRFGVAVNSNSPADILTRLSRDRDGDIRRGVAMNSNTPVAVLKKLSQDEKDDVRRWVAENTSTTGEILYQMSVGDESWQIKQVIIENPNCSVDVLDVFSGDEDEDIRGWVASSDKCSASILEELSEDEYSEVRERVAANPNCSIETIIKLLQDEEPDVRDSAKDNPRLEGYLGTAGPDERDRIERLITMADMGVRISDDELNLDDLDFGDDEDLGESRRAIESFQLWESSRPNGFKARAERARLSQDPAELDQLSRDKSYQVLIEVAQNPLTPPEALLRIIRTTWGPATEMAVNHPNCPEEALWYAADSNNYYLRMVLVQLRTCPIEILIYMLEKGDVPGVMRELKNSIYRRMNELDPEDREKLEGIMVMTDLGFKFPEEVDRDGVTRPGEDLDLDDLDI